MVQWQPAFFARSYGLGTGELGTWFTLIYGIAGMVGMFLGGEWASRVAPRNERLQLKAMAVAYCLYCLAFVLIYVATNHYLAFGLMAAGTLVGTMTTAPLFAVIQALIPGHMRATAIAVIYLAANLVGLQVCLWLEEVLVLVKARHLVKRRIEDEVRILKDIHQRRTVVRGQQQGGRATRVHQPEVRVHRYGEQRPGGPLKRVLAAAAVLPDFR